MQRLARRVPALQPPLHAGMCTELQCVEFVCLCEAFQQKSELDVKMTWRQRCLLLHGSRLLNQDAALRLIEWRKRAFAQFRLVYSAKRHGFSGRSFHARCDAYDESFVIVRTQLGAVFGGYSSVSWASKQGRPGQSTLKPGERCFLFKMGATPVCLPVLNARQAIDADPESGPTFGQGDLQILTPQHPQHGQSLLGYTYSVPKGMFRGTKVASAYLAGEPVFLLDEIEVFAPVAL